MLGLKENVILGHLIPAGTGFKPYTGLAVKHLAAPPAPVELAADDEFVARQDEEARAEAAIKQALGLE